MKGYTYAEHNVRRRQPTGHEKREYLRILLADGAQAAGQYLRAITEPVCLFFESDEEADRYKAETGHVPRMAWILPPETPETPAADEYGQVLNQT